MSVSDFEQKDYVPKPRKGFHLKFIYKPLFFIEEAIKKIGFDCRSCGQCILSTTGFVCPMRCPKQLRNGACGGSQNGMCEVNTSKKCVWNEIYEGVDALDKIEPLYKLQKPTDYRMYNKSAIVNWVDNRIDGMHLFNEGKGTKIYQLIREALHILKVRFQKFVHPSRYYQKHENHYLGA